MGPEEGSFDMVGNYYEHPSEGSHAESRIIPEMQNCVFEVQHNYNKGSSVLYILGWKKVSRCDNRYDCSHWEGASGGKMLSKKPTGKYIKIAKDVADVEADIKSLDLEIIRTEYV